MSHPSGTSSCQGTSTVFEGQEREQKRREALLRRDPWATVLHALLSGLKHLVMQLLPLSSRCSASSPFFSSQGNRQPSPLWKITPPPGLPFSQTPSEVTIFLPFYLALA